MRKKQNTFLLLSLEEEKTKKLANVINNDACRRILDFLSKKGATETEISKDMQIPISTVHYNLKLLVDSGLVNIEEFHYSEKGKEVKHYSLANKYVIIAPKNTESLASKLRGILPAFLIITATGFLLQIVFNPNSQNASSSFPGKIGSSAPSQALPQVSHFAAPLIPIDNFSWVWFLTGSLLAIGLIVAYEAIKRKA